MSIRHTLPSLPSKIPHLRLLALTALLALGACATEPAQVTEMPPPQPAPVTPPSTQVYFYPKHGQSAAQQDQDRYECYLWAMKQTGFDPSQPDLAPHQRVMVTPVPAPGHDTAVGALAGAAIGAAISGDDDRAGGAVLGAITGAAIGAASDSARQQQAQQLQESYDSADAERQARIDRQAADYRRAMAACLEGRGYSVRE
jgi:Glycine zipper 2TM domain